MSYFNMVNDGLRSYIIAAVAFMVAAAVEAGEPRQLTADGRIKTDPVFVDGSDAVVYTLQEKPTQFSLMKLKLSDLSVSRLHPAANTSEFEATFAKDDSQYAFIQSRGNLNLKLVIRDTKQNKESSFDPGGGFASLRRPAFAPDGSRIAFGIPTATGTEIVSVSREGKDQQTLTKGGMNHWPAYSPDGKQIAFCSSRAGDYDLYVMKADGSQARRVLKSAGLEARPCWSPDGKQLAFTSNRDGNYELYRCNMDGGGLKRITTNEEKDDYATWRPDGKRIVWVAERKGKFDLWIMDVE